MITLILKEKNTVELKDGKSIYSYYFIFFDVIAYNVVAIYLDFTFLDVHFYGKLIYETYLFFFIKLKK